MRAIRFTGYSFLLPMVALALAAGLALNPDMAPGHSGLVPSLAGLLAVLLLCGSAFATTAHSDLVAIRLGQPFGTLVLTLSVTIIEVSVIVSMMLHKQNNPTLARESVFSVIMIVTTGIVGLCLLLGALRHREQEIQQQGVSGFLSVIIALGVMLLVLPNETRGAHGEFTPFQLIVVSFVALGLYGIFLYMQTVRHREHFGAEPAGHGDHRPDATRFVIAIVMLLVSLLAVVLLSEHVAAGFEDFISRFQLEDRDAVTGALVATLVLLPEGISAVRLAARNHLQHSLNIALGSVLATIALTIPVMAVISVVIGQPIVLGLEPADYILMLLAFVLCILSFGTGRTNALNGAVHLIVFAVYVLLLFAP